MQNTFGAAAPQRRHHNGRALSHGSAAAARHDSPGRACCRPAPRGYAQNEIAWTPWLRTLAGLRIDGYRFGVDASDPVERRLKRAGIVSPKGGVVVGPFGGTELYANAGLGFHSNDARGATITRDPVTGEPVDPVTPLVRAQGAEVGVRTVAIPHLQTSLAVWTLHARLRAAVCRRRRHDRGEPAEPPLWHRVGELLRPRPWLMLDGDLSWSSARFTDADPGGDHIPGSVGDGHLGRRDAWTACATCLAASGCAISVRAPLIEDDSVRSKATSWSICRRATSSPRTVKIGVDVFNLFDAKDSDIDYYYASRLPGEPAGGVDDIHLHPTLPRTARVSLNVGF